MFCFQGLISICPPPPLPEKPLQPHTQSPLALNRLGVQDETSHPQHGPAHTRAISIWPGVGRP